MSDTNQPEEVDIYTCRECNSTNLTPDITGVVFCDDCGLEGEAGRIDPGKDNRVFADGSGAEGERWGMPKSELYHDGGLTTDMPIAYTDGTGQRLSSAQRRKYNRLRRQHQRTRIRDAKERNLVTALNELDRLASQMTLPKFVKENAARIYKRAVEKQLVRGRSIEGVVAACIHASCRLNNMSRTLDEIGQHSRTGRKEIGRTYKKVMNELQIRILPTAPTEYVPRFCSTLNLDARTEALARQILSYEQIKPLSTGRGPTGIAAAAVYLATRVRTITRTQRDVAMAAGVTEVTIRNRYKEICEVLGMDAENPQAPN
jgi:transcription initiation factor TFIIB|tara:strand:- start:5607 stop:6554 length:948 start_codon:yes stop_codon:yes gene_type:complete